MRKIAILFVFCIVVLAGHSQSDPPVFAPYPSIVDTLSYPDSAQRFLYQPRIVGQGVEHEGYTAPDRGNLIQRFIIDEPTELWGIAGTVLNDTVRRWKNQILYYYYPEQNYDENHLLNAQFFLYEEKNGVITAVDSIPIDTIRNPKHAYDYMPGVDQIPPFPLLEGTFNKHQTYYYGMETELTGPDTIYIGYGGWQPTNQAILFPAMMFMASAQYNPRIVWKMDLWRGGLEDIPTGEYSWWGGLFPMIRRLDMSRDTIHHSCPPPTNLSVLDYDGEGSVTLSWNSEAAHSRWQLHIVSVTDSTEAAIDTTVSVPFVTLEGLAPQVEYRAYVRALCEDDDSVVYSLWSRGVDVSYTVGIGTASESGKVYIAPNPADDRLQLSSYYGIESVELYDMRGRLMKEYRYGRELVNTYENMRVTMDINQLSRGTYIAVVHTLFGIVTRRVVKQ